MHDAKNGIAIANLIDDHPESAQIVDFFQRDLLGAHLFPDAVNVFGTSIDLGLNADGVAFLLKKRNGLGDKTLALGTLLVELARDLPVGVGIEETKTQILEFPFDLPHSQAVRQWSVDVQGLPRRFFPLRTGMLRVIAQSLGAAGEAEEDDADVLRHGKHHLSQDFGLRPDIAHAGCGRWSDEA